MAHEVTGLIAKHTVLEAFSREYSLPWPVVVLYGDLAILPLRDVDLAPFQTAPLESDGDGFRYLSERLLEELRRSSSSSRAVDVF